MLIGLGFLAVQAAGHLSASLPPPALPATPRAWLHAYQATSPGAGLRLAALTRAGRRLPAAGQSVYAGYLPALRPWAARARLGHVLRDGNTAVLALRGRGAGWSAVLERRRGGWQAVALLGA